jgi:hypothetical protein
VRSRFLSIFDTATHEGRITFQGACNDPYFTLETKIAFFHVKRVLTV